MTRSKVANGVTRNLEEWVDGFLLIGYVAGTGEEIVIAKAADHKTIMALNALMCKVVTSGGIHEAPPSE